MRRGDWNLPELWELKSQADWPCVCQESEVTRLLHAQGGELLHLSRAMFAAKLLLNISHRV